MLGKKVVTISVTEYENKSAIIPPVKHKMDDSVKNCTIISFFLAPIAFRIPISRVRSVTETSIIFIIPIPHTIREIAAIPEINNAICPIAFLICSIIFALVYKLKFTSSGTCAPVDFIRKYHKFFCNSSICFVSFAYTSSESIFGFQNLFSMTL